MMLKNKKIYINQCNIELGKRALKKSFGNLEIPRLGINNLLDYLALILEFPTLFISDNLVFKS